MSMNPQSARPRLVLLLAVTAYLYLNLFSLPHTPFLLGDDQAFFWMDAARMLDGELIYRDFIQFTAPGTDLIYLSLFKLFGLSLWVTNAVVLALGIALCWLCFSLAIKIMELRFAVLATALFLVLIYGKLLNGTHHLFSLLAIMSAVRIYGRENPFRILIAGAFLGLASFFTQTHGAAALLAFAIFLLWQRSRDRQSWLLLVRNEALLCLSFAATLLLLSAPLIAVFGWKQLWYFQVTYTRQYIVPLRPPMMGLPGPFNLRGLPRLSQAALLYLALPVVYLLALWRCWRERHHPTFPWERIALLSLVGFFLMVEVALSINSLRLYAVSLPGVILLVWAFHQAWKNRSYAVAAIWIGVAFLAAWQTIAAYTYQPRRIRLPAGEVATGLQSSEKLTWLRDHTRPGQMVFQAAWPGIYLPLQLRNPMFVDQIVPEDGTRPEEVALTIHQLEAKQVPYVLWAARLGSMDDIAANSKDHAVPLRAYLRTRYTSVHTFPDGDQLWQRNESGSSGNP